MMMETRRKSIARAKLFAEHLLAMRAGEAAATLPPRPPPAIDYPRLQHHVRWFDGVLKLYRAAARAIAEQVVVDAPDDREAGAREPDDVLIDFARRAHRILLEHPVAAKVAYAALAEQGRAFAATREGAELRTRLAGSRRLRRASLVWRSLTMGMLDEHDPGELPATYLDNLLCAVDRPDLEQLLGRLQLRRAAP